MKKTFFTTLIPLIIMIFIQGSLAAVASASDVNLARGKSATQSSIGYGGNPQRAVDGNTDGNWYANSVTHTNNSPNEWWQVDLGNVQEISKIRIWNRTDCCNQRLSKFYVFVSDSPFYSDDLQIVLNQPGIKKYFQEGVGGRPTDIALNHSGRFIRIQLAGTDYLSLAEVEVIGYSNR